MIDFLGMIRKLDSFKERQGNQGILRKDEEIKEEQGSQGNYL